MKDDQFLDLCRQEWDRDTGWPFHGDVVALSLTGPGVAELTQDVLSQGTAETRPGVAAGARLACLTNPVTRSSVEVRVADGPGVATVSYGPGQPARFVPAGTE